MPKAQSDTQPPQFIESRGKTQVNFNVEQVEVTDDQGTRQIWQYEYVEIDGKITKGKVLEAMDVEELEDDDSEWTPDETAAQHKDAKDAITLSNLAGMTYTQLDTYINNNVTDMASARVYLKKLSKVVLAILKQKI